MSSEEYFEMYLANKERIEKELGKLEIYDEDLMEDTMVDLQEWLETHKPEKNFVGLFVQFYYLRWLRKLSYDSHYDPCDYETLVRLSDNQQCEEQRAYAQQVGEQVDAIKELVKTHTFPGERCVGTARRIFNMWLDGYTYREIEETTGCDQGNICAYLRRMIKNIKKMLADTGERR